jgi:hypothetical protein
MSFGEAALADPAIENRLLHVLDQYREVFDRVTVIEHGSSTDMRSSACILHAHLHLVPIEMGPILETMVGDGIVFEKCVRWTPMIEAAEQDFSYYMVCTSTDTYFAIAKNLVLPKQYARLVLTRVLGLDSGMSDWGVISRPDCLYSTIDKWRKEASYGLAAR